MTGVEDDAANFEAKRAGEGGGRGVGWGGSAGPGGGRRRRRGGHGDFGDPGFGAQRRIFGHREGDGVAGEEGCQFRRQGPDFGRGGESWFGLPPADRRFGADDDRFDGLNRDWFGSGGSGGAEFYDEAGGVGENFGGELGVGGEIEDQAGDAGLGFADANLAELGVPDGDRRGEPAAELGAGIDEVEEHAIGVAQPVFVKNGFSGEVNRDAGDGALGPEANVGKNVYLRKRRSR